MTKPKRQPYRRFVEDDEDDLDATDTTDTVDDGQPPEDPQPDPDDPVDWKKRWSDLKKHHDTTITPLRQRLTALEGELQKATNAQLPLPKSKDEVKAWSETYPDVADIVKSIAGYITDERTDNLNERYAKLEEREGILAKERAENLIRVKHPDFTFLITTEEFLQWLRVQPVPVQEWLTKNSNDASLAIRAIDLFKMETGYVTPNPDTPKKGRKKRNPSAADAVTRTQTNEPLPTEIDGKKVWLASEIRSKSQADRNWFDKHEEELDEAAADGRIIED